MSIGISFMGFDGTKRSMTASSLAAAQNFMSQNDDDDDENLTPEERERRKQKKRQSFLATMRQVAGKRKNRLKEQKQREEAEKRKKEMADLKKKVEKLEKDAKEKEGEEENDPVDGPVVGKTNNSDVEPDGESRDVGSKGGFRIAVSRTEMTKSRSMEMDCDMVTLVKLEYDLIFSQKGYLKGRSTERKVWEQSFFVKEEGSDAEAKYSARAFWDDETSDKPTLTMIAFGDEASLDTYDKGHKDFAANYVNGVIGGTKKGIPPVKRVAVSTCTNGMKE